jgi:tRNA A-37 threonylcarbamoyl transferase component Bud32/tetratricopeptide (TPR) repeat protein
MGAPAGVIDELDERRALAHVSAGLLGTSVAAVTVGRFVLLERVGAGGMGVVYSAYDPQLDRKVAIKVLHDAADDEVEDAGLLAEARALAQLSHPNVVTVHEVGTFDGRPFLAMELVTGESLAAWMRTPRSWREVVEIMACAGDGLAAAHAAGIVHRDFKPSNVVLREDGRVIVLDFGLARADAGVESHDDDTGVVHTDASRRTLAGTPAYMAPEQHAGAEASAHSDQFAWCVSLYEALYGRLPFDTRSRTQLCHDIEEGRLAPLPDAGRMGRRRVPSWLRQAVLRGLRPAPAQRWPSMAALVEVLRNGLDRRGYRAVLPVLLAGGVALSAWSGRSEATPAEVPCADVGRAALEAVWNDATSQRVASALAGTSHPNAAQASGRAIAAVDTFAGAWQAARTEACAVARGSPAAAAAADETIACLDVQLGGLSAAVDLLSAPDDQILVEAQRLVPSVADLESCRAAVVATGPRTGVTGEARRDAERDLGRAQVLGRAGKGQEARQLVAAILDAAARGHDVGLRARARRVLGDLEAWGGDRPAAIASYQDALVDAERAGDTVARLDAQRGLAAQLIETARYDEAARLLDQAEAAHLRFEPRPWAWDAQLHALRAQLAIERQLPEEVTARAAEHLALVLEHGQDDPDRVLRGRALVARAATLAGRDDEALQQWARVRQETEARFGPVHETIATADNAAGIIHYRRGELPEAEAALRRAVHVREQVFGVDHPSLVSSLLSLGAVLARSDEAEAEAVLVRAVSLARADGPTSERHLAGALHNLAGLLKQQERFDEATAREREAWEIAREFRGESHPRTIASLCDLGEALLRQERFEEARDAFERARALEVAERGSESLGLLPALTGLAKAFDYLERPAFARAHAEHAARLVRIHDVPAPRLVSVNHALVVLLLDDGSAEALRQAQEVLAAAEAVAEHPLVSPTAREFLARRRAELDDARGG